MQIKSRESFGTLTHSEAARILTEQRTVLADYFETVRELQESLSDFEDRFDRKSADMVDAVTSGVMEETLEVSEWLTTYERYRRITRDWPALAAS